MDSFFDDAERAQLIVTIIVFLLIALGVWLGRKRLRVSIPIALLVFVVSAMIIPSAVGARQAADRNNCINNLRQIRDAKTDWAAAKQKLPSDVPIEADLLGTNMFLHKIPVCPRGGAYSLGAVNENPTCSLANRGHKLE